MSSVYNPHKQSPEIQSNNATCPFIFQSPNRYIQKAGLIRYAGDFLKFLPGKTVVVLQSKRSESEYFDTLKQSFTHHTLLSFIFEGEPTKEKVALMVKDLSSVKPSTILGFGGGKTIDFAKVVASKMDIECVVFPTLASNDAPCSALSVLYKENSEFDEVFFFPKNPAAVLVDSEIIAKAPARFLISGMGDAMATYYEALACFENENARSEIGARPVNLSLSISQLCRDLLFQYGVEAVESCKQKKCSPALEKVIEANILLSGLGFESGGLAAAHGIHNALTVHPKTHSALHGEKVAFCTLTQLVLEEKIEEAIKVAKFFKSVNLPRTLAELGINNTQEDTELLHKVAEISASPDNYSNNLKVSINPEKIFSAMLEADKIGQKINQE